MLDSFMDSATFLNGKLKGSGSSESGKKMAGK
jgi:hypothetical protein